MFGKESGTNSLTSKLSKEQCQERSKYLEMLPAPVITIDHDFTITWVNKAAADLAGIEPKQCIGKKCHAVLKTPQCRTADCMCSRAMQQGETVVSETIFDPKGAARPVQYTAKPARDAAGKITGCMLHLVDVAVSRQAITDLQDRVAYLDNAPAPVMAIDRDFTVKYINAAGAALIGRDPASCTGEKCYRLLNTAHCNTPECRLAKAMNGLAVTPGEIEATLPGGRKPIRYTGVALKDASGNVKGAIGYVTDMTGQMSLTAGVSELVEYVLKGRLDIRGDISKYQGNYAQIISGINDTLDAVVGPVKEIGRVLDLVASGDLTTEVTGEYQGDFATLKNSANTMITNLRSLVIDLGDQADKLVQSSRQLSEGATQSGLAVQHIATSSQQMARGAQDQSQSTQEVASAMNEVTSAVNAIVSAAQEQTTTIKQSSSIVNDMSAAINLVTDNAEVASDAASRSSDATRHADDMTKRTAGAVDSIKDSITAMAAQVNEMSERAKQIGMIVATIDDVASQTNLLALNAAIEAARAGEHGRGFAVVADEVRKLAERTAVATKETADIIGEMQRSVKNAVEGAESADKQAIEGAELSAETTEALNLVLEESEKVRQQIEMITAASREINNSSGDMVRNIDAVSLAIEQSSSSAGQVMEIVGKVNSSIENVAGISEENSAATEEVSASAEQVNAQVEEIVALSQALDTIAERLQKSVSVFRVK